MPLDQVSQWFVSSITPVMQAFFARELDSAQAAYDSALASAQSERDTDLARAKRLRLDGTWLVVNVELAPLPAAREVYMGLLELCAPPQPGPHSDAIALHTEMLARLLADSWGIEPLPRELLAQFDGRLDDSMRGPNYWNLIACWGFKHGAPEMLAEAYGYFTTERPNEMADWMFHRLHLMLQLSNGSATSADVLHTVKRMETLAQMLDFERLLLQACIDGGLLDKPLTAELRKKRAELEISGRHAPRRGP